MLQNPKWDAPTREDFLAWLQSKAPNETYNFYNSCGKCLIGQYMAYKGIEWDMYTYSEFVNIVLNGTCAKKTYLINQQPMTFGAALERIRADEAI